MKYLLMLFLTSSVCFAQETVVERHDNGQKKWVNKYTGSGFSESLMKRSFYEKFENQPTKIIFYSKSGYIRLAQYFSKDNGSRYKSCEMTWDGFKGMSTYYNSDGSIKKKEKVLTAPTYDL